MAGPPKNKGKPQCKDGIDNDSDGLIDFPADPGCSSSEDRDEFNEPVNVCGNNIAEGSEICDGTDLNGETCLSQGFDGGTLVCNSNCSGFETSSCFDNTCSDTDSRIDLTTQGTISGDFERIPYSQTDFCLDSTNLLEYFCGGGLAFNTVADCAGNTTTSCLNGACV